MKDDDDNNEKQATNGLPERIAIMKDIIGTTILFDCVMEELAKKTAMGSLTDGQVIQVMRLVQEFQLECLIASNKKEIEDMQKVVERSEHSVAPIALGAHPFVRAVGRSLVAIVKKATHNLDVHKTTLNEETEAWKELIWCSSSSSSSHDQPHLMRSTAELMLEQHMQNTDDMVLGGIRECSFWFT